MRTVVPAARVRDAVPTEIQLGDAAVQLQRLGGTQAFAGASVKTEWREAPLPAYGQTCARLPRGILTEKV